MKKIRLTKLFKFECAHALYGYHGKCKNIHGHSYKLRVSVEGIPIDDLDSPINGMVMDFGDLKKIVNQEVVDVFDHSLVLNKNTPHLALGERLRKEEGHEVVLVDYQPTCENMILDFVEKIQAKLPDKVELVQLRLDETDNAYAEWIKS